MNSTRGALIGHELLDIANLINNQWYRITAHQQDSH